MTANKALEVQYGLSVSFQKVKFQLFPPGIEVQNVKLRTIKDKSIYFQSGSLGAFFDLRDIFLERPTISELLVSDAKLILDFKDLKKEKNNSEKKKLEKIKVTDYIKLIDEKSPIDFKKININQSSFNLNKANFNLKKLLIRKRKSSLKLKLISHNLDLSAINKKIPTMDTINISVVLDDNEIDIKRSSLKKDTATINISGEFKNNLTKIEGKGKLNIEAEVSEISKYVDLSQIGSLDYGVALLETNFKIQGENVESLTSLKLKNFMTDFCYGDELFAKVAANNQTIDFLDFKLKAGRQNIELQEKFEFFNLKTKKFIEEDIKVKAIDLKLNNALRYIRKSLAILKGELNGNIRFKLNPNDFHFYIDDVAKIKDLYLGEKDKPILSIETGALLKSNFSVVDGSFEMGAKIELPNSNLLATGKIKNKEIKFEVKDANIDFRDFGKFAGFKIDGRGKLNLEVFNNEMGQTLIGIRPSLKEFDFESYQLGSLNGDLIFNISQSEIQLANIVGKQGKATLKGDALLNYETLNINSDISLKTKRYLDLKRILFPLLKPLDFIPDDVFGDWTLRSKISGKMNLEELKVDLGLVGYNNYIYEESFETLKFNLLLSEQVINLQNIYARKSDGSMRGEYSYNLKNEKMLYDIRFANIPLRDINAIDRSPFEFDAQLNGTLKGESSKKTNVLDANIVFDDTYVASRRVRDSKISFKMKNKNYEFSTSLFGGEIKLDGDLQEDIAKKSIIKLDINTYDIPLYLSVFKFVDKSTLNMNGVLAMRSELDFPGTNIKASNFKTLLKRFVFKKENVDINYFYKKAKPQLSISNGIVENWDLEIEGRKFYLISNGSGNLKSKYLISNEFKVDASILETMNKLVSKANGTLRGKVNFFDRNNQGDYEATLISNNMSLSTTYLPTEIKDTKMLLEYKEKNIYVKKLQAGLSAGFVDLNGSININNIIPDLNLNLKVNEAGFPIFGKSSLVVSANTTLVGKKPPYTLAGDVIINKLLVVNDIQDFTSGEDAIIKKEYDYLPQENQKVFSNYLSMNLNIDTKEPMILSNSFADIGMVGDLQLLGGENDPKVVGSLALAPRTNKITFKNNDYLLNKGNVYFYTQNKITNPELDFIAESSINDYKVNLKVYGPVKDFKLDLTSTPALAQEDILSLIAFGYTKDLSANLTDAERESMTQAGVGSILFDSFKINETLKSEFGLQVNLGTQIQQDETSLLNQRNSDATRVRSATTIEVKKKLNDAMNLSVSSTVGGSAGQRQSMNLNYNFDKNLSVEGVYETRTAPEGEEAIINDTSLGVDVKWRVPFK